jgi:hypothetical protein
MKFLDVTVCPEDDTVVAMDVALSLAGNIPRNAIVISPGYRETVG